MSASVLMPQSRRQWAICTGVGTALGIVFGLIGPYGSFLNGPAPIRVAYWTGTVWLGIVVVGLLAYASLKLASRWNLPVWAAIVASVLVACVPMTALISFVATRLWPGVIHLTPLEWYGQVLLPCAISVVVWSLVVRGLRRPVATAPATSGVEVPFDALCLHMEDHYVRAHTRGGSRLAYSTMDQAIARQRAEGLRVHRSWWVAREAVEEAMFEGRNLRLRLVNGMVVPVARSAVARVREQGWLS